MKIRRFIAPAAVGLALLAAGHDGLAAQVVEERDSEANPAAAIFRATLYGAGTGLVLGGAYALIADDDDPGTGEILRWSTAAGAGAGLVVGLLYVVTRSEPEGSADEIGMLRLQDGALDVSPARMLSTRVTAMPGPDVRTLDFNLVSVRF